MDQPATHDANVQDTIKSTAGSRVIVDLDAYAHNLTVVRNLIGRECRIMAVVKANAYGHGAVPIAERAIAEGCSMLGVATVGEGVELRQAGITAPILVLMQPPHSQIAAAVEYNLRLCVSDVQTCERAGELARRVNKVVPVHCKIDTGMGRQGFDLERAAAELLFLTRISHIDIEAIATHFPTADNPRDPYTANQIRTFRHFLRELEKEGIPFEMTHAANSPAIVNHGSSACDMVRPGLMTYGVWPNMNKPPELRLRPVLRWEAQITLLRDLPTGRSVGYGRTYTTTQPMRAALLPVGYADGYKYALSNRGEVLIHGVRCPVRGAVSMDQITVDVTHAPEAVVGDTAVLLGRDGDEIVTAEEMAALADTIPYDVLTGIGPRVSRTYKE